MKKINCLQLFHIFFQPGVLRQFGAKMLRELSKHDVSYEGMKTIWGLLLEHGVGIGEAIAGGEKCCLQTLRRDVEQDLGIQVEMLIWREDSDEPVWSLVIPQSKPREMPLPRLRGVFAYVRLAAVKAFHAKLHSDKDSLTSLDSVVLSVDGVQDSRQTMISNHVYSLRFRNCRVTHVIGILRAQEGETLDKMFALRHFVNDLNDNGIFVDHIIADAPERASLRQVKSHSAKFGCDVCRASNIEVRVAVANDDNGRRAKRRAWGTATCGKELRSDDWHRNVLANYDTLSEDERAGIKRTPSPLLDLPGLDIVFGMLPEYMHHLCSGVVLLLTEMTFATAAYKKRRHNNRMFSPEDLNTSLRLTRVPSEFQNRPRDLCLGSWKTEEYRNLILFYFPALRSDPFPRPLMDIWMGLAYAIRALCLDDEEYAHVSSVNDVFMHVYRSWESYFGAENCTYNLHLTSHLVLIRQHRGQLPTWSAFPFEGMYSRLRYFKTACRNPCKQMIAENNLFNTRHNGCGKNISYRPARKRTGKVDNSYVYTFDTSASSRRPSYAFYRLREDLNANDGAFKCSPIHVQRPHKMFGGTNTIKNLDWASVGVFHYEGEDIRTYCFLTKSDIAGKAILVNGFMVTIPTAVLWET